MVFPRATPRSPNQSFEPDVSRYVSSGAQITSLENDNQNLWSMLLREQDSLRTSEIISSNKDAKLSELKDRLTKMSCVNDELMVRLSNASLVNDELTERLSTASLVNLAEKAEQLLVHDQLVKTIEDYERVELHHKATISRDLQIKIAQGQAASDKNRQNQIAMNQIRDDKNKEASDKNRRNQIAVNQKKQTSMTSSASSVSRPRELCSIETRYGSCRKAGCTYHHTMSPEDAKKAQFAKLLPHCINCSGDGCSCASALTKLSANPLKICFGFSNGDCTTPNCTFCHGRWRCQLNGTAEPVEHRFNEMVDNCRNAVPCLYQARGSCYMCESVQARQAVQADVILSLASEPQSAAVIQASEPQSVDDVQASDPQSVIQASEPQSVAVVQATDESGVKSTVHAPLLICNLGVVSGETGVLGV
jgi:hypothetical protein